MKNLVYYGDIVAAILEKDNAVEDFRKLIGATNPAEAAPGTIRARFAKILAKMPYTAVIVMKMLLSSLHSTLLELKFSSKISLY